MKRNWSRLLKDSKLLFLIANVIFSASTFLLTLVVPFLTTREVYADFVVALQCVFLLQSLGELGLVTSFLRNYQVNRLLTLRSGLLYEVFVYSVLLWCLIFPKWSVLLLVDLGDASFLGRPIVVAVTVLLVYLFSRARLISQSAFFSCFLRAFCVAAIRVGGLVYLYLCGGSLELIFLILAVVPFIPECLLRVPALFREVLEVTRAGSWLKDRRQLVQFVYMSGATYLTTVLYAYSVRGIFVLAAGGNYQQLLADLGYAGSFLGIISIVNSTVRSYFVSRLSPQDPLGLGRYVQEIRRRCLIFAVGIVGLSISVALLIYCVKPEYLTLNAAVYAFVLVFASGLTMYIGLFNILSTTLNLVHYEVLFNAARTLAVLSWVYWVLPVSASAALVGGYLLIVAFEFSFASFVLGRARPWLGGSNLMQERSSFGAIGGVCNEQ